MRTYSLSLFHSSPDLFRISFLFHPSRIFYSWQLSSRYGLLITKHNNFAFAAMRLVFISTFSVHGPLQKNLTPFDFWEFSEIFLPPPLSYTSSNYCIFWWSSFFPLVRGCDFSFSSFFLMYKFCFHVHFLLYFSKAANWMKKGRKIVVCVWEFSCKTIIRK